MRLFGRLTALILVHTFCSVVSGNNESPQPKNCTIKIDTNEIIVEPNKTIIFINKTCEAVVCNVTGGEFKVVRLSKLDHPEEPGTDCCTVSFGHHDNHTGGTIMVQQHAEYCDRSGCRKCNDNLGSPVYNPPMMPFYPPAYPPLPPPVPVYHPPPYPQYPPHWPNNPHPYPGQPNPYHPTYPGPFPWGCRAENATEEECDLIFRHKLPTASTDEERDQLEHERQTCYNVANKGKSCQRAADDLNRICQDWDFKSHQRQCMAKCERGGESIKEICMHQGTLTFNHENQEYHCIWDHDNTQLFFKEPREVTELFSRCMTDFYNPGGDPMVNLFGGSNCNFQTFMTCTFPSSL